MRGATRPRFRPLCAAPVGSRLVFGSSRRAVESVGPLQLIGLISGVMTGVTAGAIGFIGAAAFIAGFLFDHGYGYAGTCYFLAGWCFVGALVLFFIRKPIPRVTAPA